MTALNYFFSPKCVILAMDTLGTDASDHLPRNFMTKFFPVPHIRGAITGTGLLQLLTRWVSVVTEGAVVKDMRQLNKFAPTAIREIYSDLTKDFPDNIKGFATIYHFGYLQDEERFAGYAYRLTNNFEPDELPYCFAVKPEIAYDAYAIEPDRILECFMDIMKAQKEEDDLLSPPSRIGIGGEIIYLVMQPTDMRIIIGERFNDFDFCFNIMCQKINDIPTY